MTEDQKEALATIEQIIREKFLSGIVVVTTTEATVSRWTNTLEAVGQIRIAQLAVEKTL